LARNNSVLQRLISLVLASAFLCQELAYSLPAGRQVPPLAISSTILFEAPLEYCSLKEIHKGQSGKPFIIHIQDAHANLSGQENLARTLDEIMTKYKVSLVLVEGGGTDGTLDPLKKLASPQIIKRISKKLLIEGKLAGEEYLNLSSDHPMKIMGIEDMALYQKSVENYAKLADKREAILEYLELIQSAVEKLKRKLYPKELLDYERASFRGREAAEKSQNEISRFARNDGLGDFKMLWQLAQAKNMDLKDFPDIQKLKTLQDQEKDIDFNLANLEQASLVEEIQKNEIFPVISRPKAEKSHALQNSASRFAFFQKIFEISKEKNISHSKYPNLLRYFEYLKSFSDLDLDKILDELEKFEDRVCLGVISSGAAARNPNDALLLRSIDRYLHLLETAYSIQMSTKDFEFFKINEPDFSTASYQAFLNRKLIELGYFEDVIPYKNLLEEGKKALEAFYDSVGQRDVAFVRNMEKAFKEESGSALRFPPSAFLITGGYHTQHLTKLLKDRGYSYAVLTPIVTSETNQHKYEKLLLSEVRKDVKKVEVSTVRLAGSIATAARLADTVREFAYEAGLANTDSEVLAAGKQFMGRLPAKAEEPPAVGARLAIGVEYKPLSPLAKELANISRPASSSGSIHAPQNLLQVGDEASIMISQYPALTLMQVETFLMDLAGGREPRKTGDGNSDKILEYIRQNTLEVVGENPLKTKDSFGKLRSFFRNGWDFLETKRRSFLDDEKKEARRKAAKQALSELNPEVVQRLKKEIAETGGIPFIRFHEIASAEYYRKARIGLDQSDFWTFAELPEFGEILADEIHYLWEEAQSPSQFRIVEMGAGNGTLALTVLERLRSKYPKLFEGLEYLIVEKSDALVQKQKTLLGSADSIIQGKVRWLPASAVDLPLEEEFSGVFLSNELPDAFPTHKIRGSSENELFESYVVVDDSGNFIEQWRPLSESQQENKIRDYVKALIRLRGAPYVQKLLARPGDGIDVNLAMLAWYKRMASFLKKGAVITVDYGQGRENAERSDHSAFRVYAEGLVNPDGTRDLDAANLLKYPGNVDITSDIEFPLLVDQGEQLGLDTQVLMNQKSFFKSRGATSKHFGRVDSFYVLIQTKGLPEGLYADARADSSINRLSLKEIFQVAGPSESLSDVLYFDNESVRLLARWYVATHGKTNEPTSFEIKTKNAIIRIVPQIENVKAADILFYHPSDALLGDFSKPFGIIPLFQSMLYEARQTINQAVEVPVEHVQNVEAEALAAAVKTNSINREAVRALTDQILSALSENKQVVISQAIDRESIDKDPSAKAQMDLIQRTIISIKSLLGGERYFVHFELTDKNGVIYTDLSEDTNGLKAGTFQRIYVAQPNALILDKALNKAGFLALPDISKGDGLIPFQATYLAAIMVAYSQEMDDSLARVLNTLIRRESANKLTQDDFKDIKQVTAVNEERYKDLAIMAVRINFQAFLQAARLAIQAVGGAA